MLLSICIPTFNRKEALKRQINFILKSNVLESGDIELIISDNNSNDGTDCFLSDIIKEYSALNVKVNINNKNIGLINNFHKVIELSNGKYVWILGDDDLLSDIIFEKVIKCLLLDVDWIFINYFTHVNNAIIDDCIYKENRTGFYANGLEMFENIVLNSELGAPMFISSNIFKKENILKVDSILSEENEYDNFSLPLGYSLYSAITSSNGTFLIKEVLIGDEIGGISWNKQAIRVHSRDMIKMCDIIAKKERVEREIIEILKEKMPDVYPVYKYFIYKLVCNDYKDNYALKWYLKHNKSKLIKDTIFSPFYCIKSIIIKLSKHHT